MRGSNRRPSKSAVRGGEARLWVYGLIVSMLPVSAHAATFLVTNRDDSGPGSLREAILQANAAAGADVIQFKIPGTGVQNIRPASPLPALTGPVTVNGTTQPGFSTTTRQPRIELDGSLTPGYGLTITGGNCVIRSLAINRWSSGGILIQAKGANRLEGNFIGTDVTGNSVLRNNGPGVFIDRSPGNLVGGATPAARNLISGNVWGVQVKGATASANQVVGNYIGTNAAGNTALGNDQHGVFLDGSPNAVIGGTAVGVRNLISGNGDFLNHHGVLIQGSGASGARVQGNYIGVNAAGAAALPNGDSGICILDASNCLVGGTTAAARNLISGNGYWGVRIRRASLSAPRPNANQVVGNYIGTNAAGAAGIPNRSGVEIYDATNTTVGGTAAGSRNVISGNGDPETFAPEFGLGVYIARPGTTGNKVQGNYIGVDATGTKKLGNLATGVLIVGASGNLIGGTSAAARNVISGNGSEGVFLNAVVETAFFATTDNVIQGNHIGVNAGGSAAIPNGAYGVSLNDAARNLIGGTAAGARNVISGNGGAIDGYGVSIRGSRAAGNTLQGNYIGVNAAGSLPLPNRSKGVSIHSAPNTVIGGTAAGARNVISANGKSTDSFDGYGILIEEASATQVLGNFIGTDATGAKAFGNNGPGVLAAGANTVIGGTAVGAGNLISGNKWMGVQISRENCRVQGNRIGTNLAGAGKLPNDDGIWVVSNNTLIGGTSAAARNVISGNAGIGIYARRSSSSTPLAGVTIQGNIIGADVTGTKNLGNGQSGVELRRTTNCTVGGTTSGSGNIIAFNGLIGVVVTESSVTGNAILGNSLFANGRIGIDLRGPNDGDLTQTGVTPNDAGDGDTGPNNLQNFPVLTAAVAGSTRTTVTGTLNSNPSKTFRIEFFASPVADPAGHGEGQRFLGAVNVTTNASGNANLLVALPAVQAGQVITATATGPGNNTSEFSNAVTVGQ